MVTYLELGVHLLRNNAAGRAYCPYLWQVSASLCFDSKAATVKGTKTGK